MANQESIDCLIATADNLQFIIPASTVAEITESFTLLPAQKKKEHVLGSVYWRGIEVPVLSTRPNPEAELMDSHKLLLVSHSLHPDEVPTKGFFAYLINGLPKMIVFNKSTAQQLKAPKVRFLSGTISMYGLNMGILDYPSISQMIFDEHGILNNYLEKSAPDSIESSA